MIVVYTKSACHLCDELKDQLRSLGVVFEECDIATRSEWFETYKNRVPVLVAPDGTEYDPPFTPERTEALIRLFG